jgi:hypothetical protein
MSHDEKACVNCGEDRSGEATYPTCETCGAGGRQRVVQDTYFCDACFEDFRSGEEGRWKGIGSKMPKRVTSEDPSNHGPLCARRRGEPVCLCPRPSEALPDFGPCLRCDLPSVQEEPRRCALHLERRGKCPPNAQCLACDRLGYHIEPRPRAASDDPTEHYCAACKDTGCSECADRRTMETPQGECWICGRTVSNATGVKLTPSGKLECNDAQTGSCPRSETAPACTPTSEWGCEARKKLGVARGAIAAAIVELKGMADETEGEMRDTFAFVIENLETANEATAQPEPCRPTATDSRFVDIVHAYPPGPDSSFVEVENEDGRGMKLGEWIERQDGVWVLRIWRHDFEAAMPEQRRESDPTSDRAAEMAIAIMFAEWVSKADVRQHWLRELCPNGIHSGDRGGCEFCGEGA